MKELILVPETIDELLDLCGIICRNVGGNFNHNTLKWVYPEFLANRPRSDLIVFHNGGDYSFAVWDGNVKGLVADFKKEQSGYLYAYRLGKKEIIVKYPLWNTSGWIEWVPADAQIKQPGATQFLDSSNFRFGHLADLVRDRQLP